jgi:hypothetical protein
MRNLQTVLLILLPFLLATATLSAQSEREERLQRLQVLKNLEAALDELEKYLSDSSKNAHEKKYKFIRVESLKRDLEPNHNYDVKIKRIKSKKIAPDTIVMELTLSVRIEITDNKNKCLYEVIQGDMDDTFKLVNKEQPYLIICNDKIQFSSYKNYKNNSTVSNLCLDRSPLQIRLGSEISSWSGLSSFDYPALIAPGDNLLAPVLSAKPGWGLGAGLYWRFPRKFYPKKIEGLRMGVGAHLRFVRTGFDFSAEEYQARIGSFQDANGLPYTQDLRARSITEELRISSLSLELVPLRLDYAIPAKINKNKGIQSQKLSFFKLYAQCGLALQWVGSRLQYHAQMDYRGYYEQYQLLMADTLGGQRTAVSELYGFSADNQTSGTKQNPLQSWSVAIQPAVGFELRNKAASFLDGKLSRWAFFGEIFGSFSLSNFSRSSTPAEPFVLSDPLNEPNRTDYRSFLTQNPLVRLGYWGLRLGVAYDLSE